MAARRQPGGPVATERQRADRLLDIGEVAERTGIAPSALRYYERLGLISSAERLGLRRQYVPDVVATLGLITLCRRSGFQLAEIAELMATGGRRSWKGLVERKRGEIRAQIEVLTAVADELDHALGCPSENVLDCEHFRAAVRSALPSAREAPHVS